MSDNVHPYLTQAAANAEAACSPYADWCRAGFWAGFFNHVRWPKRVPGGILGSRMLANPEEFLGTLSDGLSSAELKARLDYLTEFSQCMMANQRRLLGIRYRRVNAGMLASLLCMFLLLGGIAWLVTAGVHEWVVIALAVTAFPAYYLPAFISSSRDRRLLERMEQFDPMEFMPWSDGFAKKFRQLQGTVDSDIKLGY